MIYWYLCTYIQYTVCLDVTFHILQYDSDCSSSRGRVCYIWLKRKHTVRLEGQPSPWVLKFTFQPPTAMLMTTWEESLLNKYSSHASPLPASRFQETRSLSSGGVPAGWRWRLQGGGGVTDDSEIVRLSDRVMAGRHSLTDQARREEIREEEEDEEGSLAALSFILGRYGKWGQLEKKKKLISGGCVACEPSADTCW